MLQVGYYASDESVLVDGTSQEFEHLATLVRALFNSEAQADTVNLPVVSTGKVHVSGIIVRRGTAPNRVSFESGMLVFSIAPTLVKQFLSFMNFSRCDELPPSVIQPHYHYEYIGQGEYIAPDSVPVIFGLIREPDQGSR